MRRVWPPAALLAAALGVWELVERAAQVPGYLFPAPSAVAASLGSDAGLLASATLVTVREVVLGFLLAVVLALALAVLLHFSAALRRALLPILVLSQAVPTVVLAPVRIGVMAEPREAFHQLAGERFVDGELPSGERERTLRPQRDISAVAIRPAADGEWRRVEQRIDRAKCEARHARIGTLPQQQIEQ